MRNYWLDIALKRRIRHKIKSIILRVMRLSTTVPFNETNIEKAVDYALQLVRIHGYSQGMDEIEKIIETAVSIDRHRFVRK